MLALTLPFLLDGELAPHRVEPDGDRQKKMEWNLLLGGRHPNPERLGYTWLEFGRRAADGTTEFRTIGCGLKAVAGRGIARHWFFVTTQRVGEDLQLLPASRVPLTREKLREEIDGHGLVYDRATDYRRAVDEALFGLGEHRYEALINLLIQLRQPQLSKRPDEKLLSRGLTEALPPLSPGLVTTVAEAFRGLDEEREALRSLAEARAGRGRLPALLPSVRDGRGQAQGGGATAGAEPVRAARPGPGHGRGGVRRRGLAQLQAAAAGVWPILSSERIELEARREALQQDPAMRDAERLDQMREEARRRDDTARIREQDRDRLTGEVRKRFAQAGQAAQRAEQAREVLDAAQRQAEEAAAAAALRGRVTGRRPTAGNRTWPGPGGKRRRSPTVRPGPSGSWSGCSPRPRNGSGRWRPRAPRRTGSPRRSRPRPSGSPPRSGRPCRASPGAGRALTGPTSPLSPS